MAKPITFPERTDIVSPVARQFSGLVPSRTQSKEGVASPAPHPVPVLD